MHFMNNELDPRENIGKPYEWGMLPMGVVLEQTGTFLL